MGRPGDSQMPKPPVEGDGQRSSLAVGRHWALEHANEIACDVNDREHDEEACRTDRPLSGCGKV